MLLDGSVLVPFPLWIGLSWVGMSTTALRNSEAEVRCQPQPPSICMTGVPPEWKPLWEWEW